MGSMPKACPVASVTWHEAAAYCNALSAKMGQAACYSCLGGKGSTACSVAPTYTTAGVQGCPGYRLPTEAEWEYAYRAGSITGFHNGPVVASSCGQADANLDKIGWYKLNAKGSVQEVGQKLPNAWGLRDMSGNVEEWINDCHVADLWSAPATDPRGPACKAATSRVARGGSWSTLNVGRLTAAFRTAYDGTKPYNYTGFRCVRTLPAIHDDSHGDFSGGWYAGIKVHVSARGNVQLVDRLDSVTSTKTNANAYRYKGAITPTSTLFQTSLPTSFATSTFPTPGSVHNRQPIQSYTSRILDSGAAAPAYTDIKWVAAVPKGTTLKLRVRSASTLAALAKASFHGPTSTSKTYTVATSGDVKAKLVAGSHALNSVHDKHRYVQYQAVFEHAFGVTPVLEQVQIFYK